MFVTGHLPANCLFVRKPCSWRVDIFWKRRTLILYCVYGGKTHQTWHNHRREKQHQECCSKSYLYFSGNMCSNHVFHISCESIQVSYMRYKRIVLVFSKWALERTPSPLRHASSHPLAWSARPPYLPCQTSKLA